jgi:hypothetical protein
MLRNVETIDTPMRIRSFLLTATVFAFSLISAKAVILVQTSSPAYYNDDLGTILNLSNTGVDGPSEPFPVGNDATTNFPTAPNLSAASSILGSWLTTPWALNSHWSTAPTTVPVHWAVGTEVGVIYQFNTLSATNVVARFGVDNGIFAWLDGNYIFGTRAGGSYSQWEYTLSLGNFSAGTHYLQLLLEDHGGSNGYAVEITADSFQPGPVVIPTPDGGATMGLLTLALSGLVWARRKLA